MVLWWKCNVHTLGTTKLPDANFKVLGNFFINLDTIWCKWPLRIAKNGHNYGGRGNIFYHNFCYIGLFSTNEASPCITFNFAGIKTSHFLIGHLWWVIWGRQRSKRSRGWKPAVLWSWNGGCLVTFSIIFHVMHNQLPKMKYPNV